MGNVLVHIDETLDLDDLNSLQHDIAVGDGIVSACISDTAHHMMIVDFDEQQIDSGEVLHRVEDQGLHAELIGL